MSGECDKCSEHCLDCKCGLLCACPQTDPQPLSRCQENGKNQFYFQGKWFDSSDEMFKYVNEWQKFSTDQETAERILDSLKKDIILNVFLRGKAFTNAEFSEFVEMIFQYTMRSLNE